MSSSRQPPAASVATIPIRPARPADLPWPPTREASSRALQQGGPRDQLGRPLRDLRISVTDRCNFRCTYCMPREAFGKQHPFLPHGELLTFEEITRAARLFVGLGVRKIRLTGGEPLLRRGLDDLVAMLAALRTPEGAAPDLALTTNGVLLARMAGRLKAAGLNRVTVSLDALDQDVFRRMTDTDHTVAEVLDGIAAAQAAGLGQVKVNMVVRKGVNDHEILPMAQHFRGSGTELRFIEYMDVGQTNQWQMSEVLTSEAVRARLAAAHPLIPVERTRGSDTATRWHYADGAGSVGFISSVTQAFCGDCTRLRLSTEGRLYTCLFASAGRDLRALLRDAALDDRAVVSRLHALWSARLDRYSEQRGAPPPASPGPEPSPQPRVEMSYIGG